MTERRSGGGLHGIRVTESSQPLSGAKAAWTETLLIAYLGWRTSSPLNHRKRGDSCSLSSSLYLRIQVRFPFSDIIPKNSASLTLTATVNSVVSLDGMSNRHISLSLPSAHWFWASLPTSHPPPCVSLLYSLAIRTKSLLLGGELFCKKSHNFII